MRGGNSLRGQQKIVEREKYTRLEIAMVGELPLRDSKALATFGAIAVGALAL